MDQPDDGGRGEHERPLTIGFLGAGALARAVAKRVVGAGHRAILSNSRGPHTLDEVIERLGSGAEAGTTRDAARADVTVLAVPWDRIEDAVAPLGPWDGQIVVDTTNAVVGPDREPADLGGRTSSEVVTDALPGARLVKAFNTLRPSLLRADPLVGPGRRVIFMSGDHADANKSVTDFVESLGFAAVDLGPLAVGGALQEYPDGPLSSVDLLRVI